MATKRGNISTSSTSTSTLWCFHWPGMVFAHTVSFDKPATEAQARQRVRETWCLPRLPARTGFWHAPKEWRRAAR